MWRLLKYALAVFLVGLALPTAANLLVFGGSVAQVAGFPITIGTTVISAGATVVDLLGLNSLITRGFSTFSTTDPIVDYNCAGIATTTTGTISSGTRSLVVASNTGWSPNMGIAVANAGAGGTTELITKVTGIAGTTFTLDPSGPAASATATGQAVSHDDTACFLAAKASGKNVHLRLGTYNLTGEILIDVPMMWTGEGGVVDPHVYSAGYKSTAPRTVIQNRGTTNNMLRINSSGVKIAGIGLQQASGITPTAGYALVMGDPSAYLTEITIDGIAVLNTYGGLSIGNGGDGHVLEATIQNSYFWSLLNPTNGFIYVNNPGPAGDIHLRGNFVKVFQGLALNIAVADASTYTDNKFNECNISLSLGCIKIGSGAVKNQTFNGGSTEGLGSGTAINIVGGQGILFNGMQCAAVDTCFNWSGTSNGAMVSVNMSNAATGTGIVNTSSGVVVQKGNVRGFGGATNPSDTAPDGTASVNCASGISATTGRAKGGIITAC